jgi:hypothetical protein
MTPLEHNKYVGLSHLAYGIIHILFAGGSMLFMSVFMSRMQLPNYPDTFFWVIVAAAMVINVAVTIPSFLASYAFLKRRSWAKVMGIIAAVVAAMHIPFGTAACAYTFWFLFSEPGKTLYDGRSQALPPAPPVDWNAVVKPGTAEERYVPPSSPPDWR